MSTSLCAATIGTQGGPISMATLGMQSPVLVLVLDVSRARENYCGLFVSEKEQAKVTTMAADFLILISISDSQVILAPQEFDAYANNSGGRAEPVASDMKVYVDRSENLAEVECC